MSAASHGLFGEGKRTLRVGEADSKSHGLGLALTDIGGGVPHPASVRSDVGGQLHLRDDWEQRQLLPPHNPGRKISSAGGVRTVVVGADLEGLVTSHDQAGLAVLLVLQQADVTSTALLPLLRILLEDKQLRTHLEELLLGLLVCLRLDLLGQADYGLEVDILGLGGILAL